MGTLTWCGRYEGLGGGRQQYHHDLDWGAREEPGLIQRLGGIQQCAATAIAQFEQLQLLRWYIQLELIDDGTLEVAHPRARCINDLEGGAARQLDEQRRDGGCRRARHAAMDTMRWTIISLQLKVRWTQYLQLCSPNGLELKRKERIGLQSDGGANARIRQHQQAGQRKKYKRDTNLNESVRSSLRAMSPLSRGPAPEKTGMLMVPVSENLTVVFAATAATKRGERSHLKRRARTVGTKGGR